MGGTVGGGEVVVPSSVGGRMMSTCSTTAGTPPDPVVPKEEGGGGEVQFLVRLLNRTHVLSLPASDGDDNPSSRHDGWRVGPILMALSARTGIPWTHLVLRTPRPCPPPTSSSSPPSSPSTTSTPTEGGGGGGGGGVHFLSASLRLYVRGGKGGFGTQLKSASKRAAAKTTLDFGACRDLSGRRLRHVNDEVKLRKWREYNARRERGLPVDETEYARTKSGVHNWHLDVPNWALELFSEKAVRENQRRIVREMERQRRAEEAGRDEEKRRRAERERAVLDYAKVVGGGDQQKAESKMEDAVAQGMRRRRELAKRQKRQAHGSPSAATGPAADAVNAGGDGAERRRKVGKLGKGDDVHRARFSVPVPVAVAAATGDDAAPGGDGGAAAGDSRAATSSSSVAAAAGGGGGGDLASAASASICGGAVSVDVDVGGPVSGCEWFCSLSGDFLEPDSEPGAETEADRDGPTRGGDDEIRVQAAGDFSTGCVLLPANLDDNEEEMDVVRDGGLFKGKWYYEVVVETAGVAQLGWAARGFSPDSDTGDGVGDDHCGYGCDGSRGLKFHAPPPRTKIAPAAGGGAEPQMSASDEEGVSAYPDAGSSGTTAGGAKTRGPWRPDDVVGCILDADSGTISYSLNGEDLGVAFRYGSHSPLTMAETAGTAAASSNSPPAGDDGASPDGFPVPAGEKNGDAAAGGVGLFPAISLNRGEVARLRIGPKFDHLPEGYRGIYESMGRSPDEASLKNALDVDDTSKKDQKQITGAPRADSVVASSTSSASSHLLLPPKLEEGDGKGGCPSSSQKRTTHGPPHDVSSDTIDVASISPAPASALSSKRETLPEPLDLSSFESASELEKLGLDRLKNALMAISVKCGGSLDERAKRLFSLKGLNREDYPIKVRTKNFVP